MTLKINKENINVFDPRGRLHRLHYCVLIVFCNVTIRILLVLLGSSTDSIFLIIILLYMQFCAVMKRLNDIQVSRWLILLILIPIINIVFGLYLLFMPGKLQKIEKDNL